MAVNPIGAVQLYDYGNPRVISVSARETISGGQFVGASGTTAVVSSGTSSFAVTDIQGVVAQGGSNFIGVALSTVTSGLVLPVAIDGAFIVRCDGSVFAGQVVKHAGNDAVQNLGSQVIPASAEDSSMAGNACGRALTAGASGGFCVAHLRL